VPRYGNAIDQWTFQLPGEQGPMYASIASPRHPDPRTITIARSKRLNRHHGLQTRLRERTVI
jgi:hypothetical protein